MDFAVSILIKSAMLSGRVFGTLEWPPGDVRPQLGSEQCGFVVRAVVKNKTFWKQEPTNVGVQILFFRTGKRRARKRGA